jgi:tetratricopeptide (TPR) repeat protein
MKARFLMLLLVTGTLVFGCAGEQTRVAGDATAYYNRGNAYADKRDYDQAIQDFTKAIELNPRNGVVYYNRGVAYGEKGQDDQAIQDFTKAIELNPRFAEAYYSRGSAYGEKGQHDQAIRDLKKACELGLQDACKKL